MGLHWHRSSLLSWFKEMAVPKLLPPTYFVAFGLQHQSYPIYWNTNLTRITILMNLIIYLMALSILMPFCHPKVCFIGLFAGVSLILLIYCSMC